MKKVIKAITKVIMIVIITIIGFKIIQKMNFNGLQIGVGAESSSVFSRDKNEKYNGEESYKIQSDNYSDAMLFKTIKTQKNSVYKVSCKVKTKDVKCKDGEYGGFNICMKDKVNKSSSLSGTNDWTSMAFYFNSYNNEKIDIGFRLGENTGDCKGTVWICDMKIEQGIFQKDKKWNFATFIIDNTDLTVGNEQIKQTLNSSQKNSISRCMSKFKSTCESFSNGRMEIDYQIFDLDDTLKSISYDKNTGYAITQKDVYKIINGYLYNQNQNFDHIFIVANIGDKISNEKIDWIGLGGTLYDNIGFSNIRISGDTLKSYNLSSYNTFSEEVFLHEFLHTLEHNMKDIGYENIIALHDNEKYNYENKSREGLKKWYYAYMNSDIKSTKIALTDEVYNTQPVNETSFKKSYELKNCFFEDRDFIQRISEKISRVF